METVKSKVPVVLQSQSDPLRELRFYSHVTHDSQSTTNQKLYSGIQEVDQREYKKHEVPQEVNEFLRLCNQDLPISKEVLEKLDALKRIILQKICDSLLLNARIMQVSKKNFKKLHTNIENLCEKNSIIQKGDGTERRRSNEVV